MSLTTVLDKKSTTAANTGLLDSSQSIPVNKTQDAVVDKGPDGVKNEVEEHISEEGEFNSDGYFKINKGATQQVLIVHDTPSIEEGIGSAAAAMFSQSQTDLRGN